MKPTDKNISDICHAFANKQSISTKSNNKRIFINGDTIYSYGYHFPMGVHVTNKSGAAAILITSEYYSSTTAKHVKQLKWSGSHLLTIDCKELIAKDRNKINFQNWICDGEKIQNDLATARKPEIYFEKLQCLEKKVRAYSNFFGIKINKELMKIFDFKNFTEVKEKILIRKKAEQEKALLKYNVDIEKFKMFEIAAVRVKGCYDQLRYNTELNRIETTQEIHIPFEIAKRFYEDLKAKQIIKGSKILNFKVTKINGTCSIGCHTFSTAHMLDFGKSIFEN